MIAPKPRNIVILGGAGFVGLHLCRALARAGHSVTVLTRNRYHHREATLCPHSRVISIDVYDTEALRRAADGHQVAINLVGILNERGRDGKGFRRAHVELTERVLQACRETGVQRYLHMSALGAGVGASHYLRTKGDAEQRVRTAAAKGLQATIFRPSVIFGRGDSFFNRFATLLRIAPVLPLACPESRMQPVWVGDVAAAFTRSLEVDWTHGAALELGGPRQYSLLELVTYSRDLLGLRRWILPLPDWAARLQAAFMDWVPGKPFSTDNYRSLQVDSITGDNALPRLNIRPASVESTVPGYLKGARRERLYSQLRAHARRG